MVVALDCSGAMGGSRVGHTKLALGHGLRSRSGLQVLGQRVCAREPVRQTRGRSVRGGGIGAVGLNQSNGLADTWQISVDSSSH